MAHMVWHPTGIIRVWGVLDFAGKAWAEEGGEVGELGENRTTRWPIHECVVGQKAGVCIRVPIPVAAASLSQSASLHRLSLKDGPFPFTADKLTAHAGEQLAGQPAAKPSPKL